MADICITKTCKDCGEPFNISKGELEWLEQRGLSPFERCFSCRKKRREENGQK